MLSTVIAQHNSLPHTLWVALWSAEYGYNSCLMPQSPSPKWPKMCRVER